MSGAFQACLQRRLRRRFVCLVPRAIPRSYRVRFIICDEPPACAKYGYAPASHIITNRTRKSQGGRAHAPTHRLHPPLLPILYPHLKKAGAPPVESLRQRAQQEARQRWNLPITQLATLSSLPVCAGTIPPRTRRSTMLDKIIATFCILDEWCAGEPPRPVPAPSSGCPAWWRLRRGTLGTDATIPRQGAAGRERASVQGRAVVGIA